MSLFSRMLALFSLVGSLSLVGCGASPTTPNVIGSWSGTMQVNEAAAGQTLPPEAVAKLKQMKMEMTFRNDGTLKLVGETNGQPYTSENRWQLVATTENKVSLKTVDSSGKEKPVDLLFNGSDTFEMPLQTEVANLGSMKFQRLK
jgi:hypothetical protein